MSRYRVIPCRNINITPCKSCITRKDSSDYKDSLEVIASLTSEEHNIQKILRVSWVNRECKVHYLEKE